MGRRLRRVPRGHARHFGLAGLILSLAATGQIGLSAQVRELHRVTTQQAIRASRVDHALGVQTDLTTGNWSSIPTMIAEAQYIGAETVRVYVPTEGNWTTRYGYTEQLTDAGLKLDLVADTGDTPARNVAAIAAFVTAHPGSVALIEGPNEPNNNGVQYAGLSGVAGALAWQHDFYAALNANPATADIPVAGVSSWPYVAAASDENNLHVYPDNGDQPLAAIAANIAQQNAVDPNKPFAITEMGWSTLPGVRPQGANMAGVDTATQAKLLLNGYMDAASLGATHVGLYDLRDWATAPGDFYSHFGLFFSNDTPKPAAVALHNMQAILADAGASADSFTPGSLDYALSAQDVRSMLLQKSSGEFVLALWREPDIWNEAGGVAINAAGESVTLRVGGTADAAVYDPLIGTRPISNVAATNNFTLTVTDHPIFVTLSGVTAAAAAVGAGGAANLLINGSFETGPSSGQYATLGTGSTVIAGWTVTKGNIDDIHQYWQAADGSNSLDMNGDTAGTIAQTFATTAGTQYDVRFYLAGHPGDQAVHGLHVAAAGQSQDYHADSAGHSQGDMGWTEQSFHFTAVASSTTLEFSGLDASYWGAALDNVSVIKATTQPVVPAATVATMPTLAPSASTGTELLINGSFETGPSIGQYATLGTGSTAIAGWTVTKGNIDDIHQYWQAADGSNSLDMNGDTAGTIAQTFATTAGTQYDVRFYLAGHPGDQAVHGLHVAAAGQSQDYHADSAGHSQGDMGWTEQSFHFTATAASTTLEFSGLDASYWGAALDNVSVKATTAQPAVQLTAAVPTPSAAKDLLINGSFETGPSSGQYATLGTGSTAITGWTVTKGNIDDIHQYWQAADGSNSLDMNGDTAGTIAQTFATTAGTQYDVRFYLAGHPGDQAVHGLHVAAAGQSQDYHADSAGHSQGDMGWTEQSFHFTAVASSTTLEFSGLDASYWGAALDNVSVFAADHPLI